MRFNQALKHIYRLGTAIQRRQGNTTLQAQLRIIGFARQQLIDHLQGFARLARSKQSLQIENIVSKHQAEVQDENQAQGN